MASLEAGRVKRREVLTTMLTKLVAGQSGTAMELAGFDSEAAGWDKNWSSWGRRISDRLVTWGMVAYGEKASANGGRARRVLVPTAALKSNADWLLSEEGITAVGWADAAKRMGLEPPSAREETAEAAVTSSAVEEPPVEVEEPPAEGLRQLIEATATQIRYLGAIVEHLGWMKERFTVVEMALAHQERKLDRVLEILSKLM